MYLSIAVIHRCTKKRVQSHLIICATSRRRWHSSSSWSSSSSSKNDDRFSHLVLLRHGESIWNATPTFTGWCNPPLTERGINEAKEAGKLLAERGYTEFHIAFTSMLDRAIDTCNLALDAAGCASIVPVVKAYQLNERHYGALQGRRKNDPLLLEKYGAEQLLKWRRNFDAIPPPMDENHEFYLPPPAPLTESLELCQKRVLQYFEEAILPELQPGNSVLVVAHSNSLRALKAHIDNVPEHLVPNIHIPNSVPCVYHFNPTCGSVVSPLLQGRAGETRGQWLFSPENQRRLHNKIGATGAFTRAIFEAWDINGDGVLEKEEIAQGLRQLIKGEDIAIRAMASKLLEEVYMEGKATLTPEEFEAEALLAFRDLDPDPDE